MTPFEAIILGIVQGVTEFLPVSSSGHLVIVQQFMQLDEGIALAFDAIIHLGSILAVSLVYRREIGQMLIGLSPRRTAEARAGRTLLLFLVLATLPLVVVGLLLRDLIGQAFESLYVSVAMLYLTGALLFVADKSPQVGRDPALTRKHVSWMGVAQVFAVLPGLSRSGVTIVGGMFSGLSREEAARFSFLMSIPANLGASLFELRGVLFAGTATGIGTDVLVLGTLAAVVASYLAIVLLLRFLRNGRLLVFAYYAWGVATIVLGLAVAGARPAAL